MESSPSLSLSSSTPTPAWWPWAARARIFKKFWQGVTDPSNTFTLAVSAFSVFSIAFAEALLRSDASHKHRLAFCARYARAQLLPSIIWLTADPNHFAYKYKDKKTNLTPLLDDASKLMRESIKRKIFFLSCLRSVIFGFVGIAQILRCVELASDEAANYRERVLTGKEPLMTGIGNNNSGGTTSSSKPSSQRGRVIRLAGKTSDVTELSLARYGHQIIPVFEEPCLKSVRRLMTKFTDNGILPLGWNIAQGEYGVASSWEGFKIESEWLFSSKNKHGDGKNKEILIVEADSSVGEQSLALGNETQNDLTLADASQGFRMISELLLEKQQRTEEQHSSSNTATSSSSSSVLRVLLADLRAQVQSGGGGSVSCREFVERRQLADVLLDAQAPLILAIREWAERADDKNSSSGDEKKQGKKRMIFDTSNAEYFQTVQRWLKPKGWEVFDRHAINCERSREIPRLVYEQTTHETVHSAFALLDANLVAENKICLLLDNANGIEQMKMLKRFSSKKASSIERVCSSELYDGMFSTVRKLAIDEGKSVSEIQHIIDAKFNAM